MLSSKILNLFKLHPVVRATKKANLVESSLVHIQTKRLKSDLYEPDYLISMEPDEPVHECLNIQLKGYDFTVLEACQKQIHKYAQVMGIQIEEGWATPAQKFKIHRFKPSSAVVDAEYQLNVYERNIQVVEVPAWALGSLLRVCRALLPGGVALAVHAHEPAHDELRYVPDNQLLDLRQQLDELGGSRAERKKKK